MGGALHALQRDAITGRLGATYASAEALHTIPELGSYLNYLDESISKKVINSNQTWLVGTSRKSYKKLMNTDFGEDVDINALKKKFSGAKNDGSKEAKYRRFLSILKIIITFLQIMSNLDTTFSHVPWPLEFSWFLKIFDFVRIHLKTNW